MPTPVETVELLRSDPAGLGREELLAGITSAEELRSWIAAREGRFARALDALPKDPSSPAKDVAGEMERKQKISRGKAKARAERAKQLEGLPGTESALEDGAITDAHADAMARARAKADAQARAALEDEEDRLLEQGANETAWEFQQRIDRFIQNHSQDDGRDEWKRKKDRQRLSLSKDAESMTQIHGQLAPEDGQQARRTLLAIADELYRRDHHDHPADQPVPFLELTNEARLAEAFVEACRRAEQFGGVAANIDRAVVVMAYDDLVGRDGPAANTSTLKDGTPVPASVARRMACDAGKVPLVLGGKSIQMDYGRALRIASPGQNNFLHTIWDTCSFADCMVPVEWTQTHHTKPFNDDGAKGKTDIGELTPCCTGACHDRAHTPGWQFFKDPDTHATTTIAPDGTTWHRMPNGTAIKTKGRSAQPPPAAAPTPDHEPAATLFTEAA
jgi:hypothetical protein